MVMHSLPSSAVLNLPHHFFSRWRRTHGKTPISVSPLEPGCSLVIFRFLFAFPFFFCPFSIFPRSTMLSYRLFSLLALATACTAGPISVAHPTPPAACMALVSNSTATLNSTVTNSSSITSGDNSTTTDSSTVSICSSNCTSGANCNMTDSSTVSNCTSNCSSNAGCCMADSNCMSGCCYGCCGDCSMTNSSTVSNCSSNCTSGANCSMADSSNVSNCTSNCTSSAGCCMADSNCMSGCCGGCCVDCSMTNSSTDSNCTSNCIDMSSASNSSSVSTTTTTTCLVPASNLTSLMDGLNNTSTSTSTDTSTSTSTDTTTSSTSLPPSSSSSNNSNAGQFSPNPNDAAGRKRDIHTIRSPIPSIVPIPKHRRTSQTDLPAVAQNFQDLCLNSGGDIHTNDPCVQLAGIDGINGLLSTAAVCDQQNNADNMIDFAKSPGVTNQAALIAAAIAITPSTPYCTTPPRNQELVGVFNAQLPGVNPGLFGGPSGPIVAFGSDGTCPAGQTPDVSTCSCA
ncbi:hypothetical protein BGW80DRAFT_1268235 [Lactifluus volemus]|nr:hypothetical protein BGW80DRAFT_1268235 [Lactifluus volemus]